MRPKRLLGLAALVSISLTCSFPTDESDQVFVSIVSLDTAFVVRRGERLDLHASMWRVSGSDTVAIPNGRFSWTTADPSIATVRAGGLGAAEVTGVNAGVVHVHARSLAFERAQSAQFAVRVANAVEVDSVRPRLVRWGDRVTVYGVGVDSLVLSFLGPVTLFDYPIPGILTTRTHDSLGFSTASFWVPPPALTDSVSFIGPGVFGFARETTYVLPFDVYEPNETSPWLLDLEAPAIVPSFPALRFFNPAIAFEPVKRDETGADWYRFSQTTPRDLTIIINSADVRGTFQTFLSDSLYWDPTTQTYQIGYDAWTIGPGTYICHGRGFAPLQEQPDSTIVALRRVPVPQDTLDALSIYSEPGRYGVTVLEGYVVSNPLFPRDHREEDDFCNAADAQPRPVVNGLQPHRDTLTIDNPFEVDWLRFRVQAPATVQFRLASLVPGDTLSDVDLYVLSDTMNGLAELGSGQNVGSSENLLLALPAGEYYAVAVDYAGVPTRYALCIGSSGCATGFPSAAVGRGNAASKTRVAGVGGPTPAGRSR